MHDIFNYTLAGHNETSVRLHRQWINTTSPTSADYKGADLYLSVPLESAARLVVTPGDNGTWSPPVVDILVPEGGQGGIVRVQVVANETSLRGLDTEELFLGENTNGTEALKTALEGLASGNSSAAQQVRSFPSGIRRSECVLRNKCALPQVSFLTYAAKFTAGGWRFLTVCSS